MDSVHVVVGLKKIVPGLVNYQMEIPELVDGQRFPLDIVLVAEQVMTKIAEHDHEMSLLLGTFLFITLLIIIFCSGLFV